MTIGNSKSEWVQGDYQDKAQELFMTMRVRVTEYKFLQVLL